MLLLPRPPPPASCEVRGQLRGVRGLEGDEPEALPSPPPRPHCAAGTVVVGLFLRLYQNSTPDRSCVRLFRCFYLLWQVPCICLCLSHLLTNFFSILCLGREARARRRASLYSILSRSVSFTFVLCTQGDFYSVQGCWPFHLCHFIIVLSENRLVNNNRIFCHI